MGELFLLFLGFTILILGFCDNVIFLDAQKKVLNHKFDSWWKTVENYDKLKFALVFAQKVNEILDLTFGTSHYSKKLVVRCFKISAGMLLITLSVLGLTSRQPFGATPWKAYSDSINFILNTTDDLASPSNYTTFKVVNVIQIASQINTSTNLILFNIKSNYLVFTMTTNGIYDIERFEHVGNGNLAIQYHRLFGFNSNTNKTTNSLGKVTISTTTLEDLVNDIKKLHNLTAKYNSKVYMVTYSIGFYIVLFTVNTFLFILSLAFCRTILREVEKSGRIITTFSLVFTNLVFVFGCSCVLLLFLTILAIPLFWLLIPVMYQVSADSLSTVVVYLASATFALLVTVGGSTKLVLFISLLPSMFAAFVGLFSLFAIKWRNGFYFIVKQLFIRLSQKNPFAVLIGIIVLVSGLIDCAAKFIHFLGFL
jgi:hypothetical protein